MKTNATLTFILMAFLTGSQLTYAEDMDMSGMNMETSANTEESQAVGVVDEIDEAKGVATISHEPIKSLNWPAMTMNFTVNNKKLLSKLSKGKKIHFSFVHKNGKYIITNVK